MNTDIAIRLTDWSIHMANNGQSKLTEEILMMRGLSSVKMRHFLNNLCSIPDNRYLEVGVWQGSTFISAVYDNEMHRLPVGIDDFSYGTLDLDVKLRRSLYCNIHLKHRKYKFIDQDCFTVDLVEGPGPTIVGSGCGAEGYRTYQSNNPFDIYFYDGDHDEAAQEKGITHFANVLSSTVIIVVDDWNWATTKNGTAAAFKKLNWTISKQWELPATGNQDQENWWNGVAVFVINK